MYVCMYLLQGDSKNGSVIQCSTTQRLSAVGHSSGARQWSDPQHCLCCLQPEGLGHCKEVSTPQAKYICTVQEV